MEEECALAKHLENSRAERTCTPCTVLQKQVLASLMQFLGVCVASLMGRFVPVEVGSHGAVLPTVIRRLRGEVVISISEMRIQDSSLSISEILLRGEVLKS